MSHLGRLNGAALSCPLVLRPWEKELNMQTGQITSRIALVTMFAASLSAHSAFAFADCTTMLPLDGGMDSYVYSLIEYNQQMIAGGDFTTAGGQNVGHIAKWDGANWVSLGGPFSGMVGVRHMTVFNGELIVSGGGALLGRWNGSTWTTQNVPNGQTNAFAVHNNEFIIGGQFFSGNNFVNALRWNFSTGTWQAIGAPGTFGTYSIKALTVYNGQLFAGGDFFVLNGKPAAGLAKWNQAAGQWEPFDPGLNNNASVMALTVYNNDLIVAGGFGSAGGVNSRGVIRWNAKDGWRSMDGGVTNYVDALTIYHNQLIVGGVFTDAGGTPVNNIARWNDTLNEWQPVADGVTNCCGYGASVYCLGVSNDKLFAGGWFGFGGEGPQRIVAWQDCPLCLADVTGTHVVDLDDPVMVITFW